MPKKSLKHEETLKEIRKQVQRFAPSYIDRDNLCGEIWIEIHRKKIPPYVGLVKHRCIDAIRARTRRKEAEGLAARSRVVGNSRGNSGELTEHQQDVDRIISLAGLNGEEKLFVFKYFYQGKTLGEITCENHMTKHKLENLKHKTLEKLKRAGRFLERKKS